MGSVTPFPFWILNKYLKLRQWNDASVAVCFFEKPRGRFLARLERNNAQRMLLPPKEVGRGRY